MSFMDAAGELKKIVEELRATVVALDAIQTPELVRPDLPGGKPVTEELAHWSIRIYAYSILCQFREMLRSTLLLFDAGEVPAVFLCCRALFEMGAHAYYVKKHAFQHLDKKDFEATWKFLVDINAGSRYIREKQEALGANPPFGESPHIAKVIACFNEYFEEARKEKPATDDYSFLSEFCHPNSFAFTTHIDWQEPKSGVAIRVKFAKPSPEICIQALPSALISCMALLTSTDKLLSRTGDQAFAKAAGEFAKIVDTR